MLIVLYLYTQLIRVIITQHSSNGVAFSREFVCKLRLEMRGGRWMGEDIRRRKGISQRCGYRAPACNVLHFKRAGLTQPRDRPSNIVIGHIRQRRRENGGVGFENWHKKLYFLWFFTRLFLRFFTFYDFKTCGCVQVNYCKGYVTQCNQNITNIT